MSAVAAAPPGAVAPAARPRLFTGSFALRAAPFYALALFAANRWATVAKPAETGKMLALALLACAFALALRGVCRLRGVLLALAAIALSVAFLALMLLIAGVPSRFLAPAHWDRLFSGIGRGIDSLARGTVPYEAADPWGRIVLFASGGLLIGTALGAALVPTRLPDWRRAAAASPLIAMVALPAVMLPAPHVYLQGGLLFLLLAACLWLERAGAQGTLRSGALITLVTLVALLVTPLLDTDHPWLSYQRIAAQFEPGPGVRFHWNHTYGPLNWPRTGAEMIRVKARFPAYWKAENLDRFDGMRWRVGAVAQPGQSYLNVPPAHRNDERWQETIRVVDRGLRGSQIIGAGVTTAVFSAPSPIGPAVSPGTWLSQRDLHPGDSYLARTYVPRPGLASLAAAGADYSSSFSLAYMSIGLPRRVGRAWRESSDLVEFPGFHSGGSVLLDKGGYRTGFPAEPVLRRSPYERAYELARRLAAQSATPWEFVRRVRAFLGRPQFRYDEVPPHSAVPLEGFLFGDHLGYCQQFSGAMALLLRMGGVPARVATGFTTGTLDKSSGEYVVHDYDAHSWVEAWFPDYGWVTLDPTPQASPALRGLRDGSRVPVSAEAGDPARRAGQARPPSYGGNDNGNGETQLGFLAWIVLAAVVVGLAALLLLGRRRARRTRAALPDPVLAELDRALRVTGRPARPGSTLLSLEHHFRELPDAAAYIRAVRLSRFGGEDRAPTPAERRALRAALASGLGWSGRLRALWALPPKAPSRRSYTVRNGGSV